MTLRTDLNVFSQRLSLSFELINQILYTEDLKSFAALQEHDSDLVDIAMNISKAVRFLNQGFGVEGVDLDDYVELSTGESFRHYWDGLFMNYCDVEDIINIADDEARKETKKKERRRAIEQNQGYKAIMTIGMYANVSQRCQTLLGDQNVMEVLVGCLKECKDSAILSKWCLWALIVSFYDCIHIAVILSVERL